MVSSHNLILTIMMLIFLVVVQGIPPTIVVTKFVGEYRTTGSSDNPVRLSSYVEGIAVDPADGKSLFIADSINNCIRRFDRYTNTMATVVGTCASANGYVDGPMTAARFFLPMDVRIQEGTGNIFIRDNGNNCLRMFNRTTRRVETYLGICSNNTDIGRGYRDGFRTSAFLSSPASYYPWRDKIIVLDSSNMCIRRLDIKTGMIGPWIGLCGFHGAVDGSFANARLGYPFALAVDDQDQNMFVTDAAYHCIRNIDLVNEQVSTYAGVCGLTNNGFRDGPVSQAQFYTPIDIIYDTGNLILTEAGSYCLRRISGDRIVSTYAGMCGYVGFQDGAGTSAVFTYPSRMALEKSTGNIFLTDSGNSVVRMLRPECPSFTTLDRASYDCKCVPGFGGAACSYCPAGSFKNSTGLEECTPCPLGTESLVNRIGCSPCPPGKFRMLATQPSCATCPANSNCQYFGFKCLSGYGYDPINLDCVQCAQGTFKSAIANTDCSSCPVGTESSSDRKSCNACTPGNFRNSPAMSSCLSCPIFSNCNAATGFVCMSGYRYDSTAKVCAPVPEATKTQTQTLKPSPTNACPRNGYCAKGIIRCYAGFEFSEAELTCSICQPGSYSIGAGNSLNRCLPCPRENYVSCFSSGFTCSAGFSQDFETGACFISKAETNMIFDMVGGNQLLFGAVLFIFILNIFFAARCCWKHWKKRQPFPSSSRKASTYSVSQTRMSSYALGTTATGSNPSLNSSRQQLKRANSAEIYRSADILKTRDDPPPETKVQWAPATTTTSSGFEVQGVLSMPGFLQYLGEQHFKMGDKVTQGGSGSIFKGQALHPDLGGKSARIIVIKQFPRPATQNEIDIFQQEVSIMYMLKEQKHIVKLLGYSTKPYYSILMKDYPTGSLEGYIQTGKYLNCKSTILVFLQDIASGVKVIHSNGIAHCDLKLSNILLNVDKSGSLFCVITDFGVARVFGPSAMKVSAFRTINRKAASVAFASPETLKNMRSESTITKLDPSRADIFSFAMICKCLMKNECSPWTSSK